MSSSTWAAAASSAFLAVARCRAGFAALAVLAGRLALRVLINRNGQDDLENAQRHDEDGFWAPKK